MTREQKIVLGTRGALVWLWTWLIVVVLTASFKDHALEPSRRARMRVNVLVPEGWAFFTKTPFEPDDYLYRWNGNDHALTPIELKNAEFRYILGLRKTPRLRSLEVGVLAGRAPRRAWRNCESGLTTCISRGELPVTDVPNIYFDPKFCGLYLIERRAPIHWAWRHMKSRVHLPSSLLLVNAICPTNQRATSDLLD